jgi:F-type H+-transporting ATPase subunit epsilon
MQLTIDLPHKPVLEEEVTKIIAEGEHGQFCLLPRRRDLVSVLVPGILVYVPEDGDERYAAVDDGLLVKQGSNVNVSVREAVVDAELGELEQMVNETYRNRDEEERRAETAMKALESSFMKQIGELENRE